MRTKKAYGAVLAVAVAATLAFGAAATASASPLPGASTETAAVQKTVKRDIALILDYRVVAACTVYPNFPNDGVIGNNIGWTIDPTDIVAWRYNINETWAMISDKKYRNTDHPWWGVVKQSCIGGSVGGEHFPTPTSSYPADQPIPTRVLEGRSAVEADHYRTVDFSPASATVVDDHKLVNTKGTLRDAANRFVIGNVFPGWHVHATNVHDQGWTKVYVPNAKRWGWVQDIHF